MEKRKKVGLVLSAGAARGFAHIGVIKALKENDIPIDIITGTSMGALIGGIYATGTDIDYIEQYARNVSMSKILDFSIKDGGFLRGKKVEDLLRIVTGNKSIEQLDMPFSCAAINLRTGQVKDFDQGGLYEAIRASISMPGVFAPYMIEGETYIDGGPLSRMPIKKAKELGAEITIAVDVSWRGQDMEIPGNAIGVLRNALSFATWAISREQEKEADILITPDVLKANPFNAKECGFCIEEGEKATRAMIDDIKKLL